MPSSTPARFGRNARRQRFETTGGQLHHVQGGVDDQTHQRAGSASPRHLRRGGAIRTTVKDHQPLATRTVEAQQGAQIEHCEHPAANIGEPRDETVAGPAPG